MFRFFQRFVPFLIGDSFASSSSTQGSSPFVGELRPSFLVGESWAKGNRIIKFSKSSPMFLASIYIEHVIMGIYLYKQYYILTIQSIS